MGDAATVLLALGPAAITGLLGYYGARLQAQTSLEQAAAQTRELLLQHSEGKRQHRQGTYHEFLRLMYGLDLMLGGFAPLSRQAFDTWLAEFQSLYGGMDLFGSRDVRALMPAMRNALDQIGLQAQRDRGSAPFEERFAAAYRRDRGRISDAMTAITDAMRADVFRDSET